MKHAEIKAMMAAVSPVIKEYATAALSPVVARLDALEKQIGAMPVPMTSDDARLVILAEIKSVSDTLPAMVITEVEKAVAAIPAPAELPDIGAMVNEAVAAIPPAQDGKSITVEDVRPLIEETVSTAFSALPVPRDGKDADMDAVAAMVGERVLEAFDGVELPKDGKDGRDGIDGKDGAAGQNGRDGLDAVEFLRGADGHLICTMSNGTTRDLGEVNGKDGEVVAVSEISDGEFQRRVDSATSHEAISQRAVAIRQSNGEARSLQVMREVIVGAMKDTKPPAVHVSVPITMPKRGREVMTVEHDSDGRIKRSVKEEVD